MDFKQLQYFVTIAEEKNLTKAASRLFISQSTLSLYLTKLEKELGVQLFERKKTHLVITENGLIYLNACKQILHIRDALYNKLQNQGSMQILKIGISSLMIIRLFSDMLAKGKLLDLNLKIVIIEGRTSALLKKLSDGEIDLAIIASDHFLKSDLFEIKLINKDPFVIVIPENHSLAFLGTSNFENVPLVDDMSFFNGESFALTPSDTSDFRIASSIINSNNLNVHIVCQINDTFSKLHLIRERNYLTIMPLTTVPANAQLVVCAPPETHLRFTCLVKRKNYILNNSETNAVERFMELYKTYIKGRGLSSSSLEDLA